MKNIIDPLKLEIEDLDLKKLPPQQPELGRINFDLNQLRPKTERFQAPVVEPETNTGANLLDFASDVLQKPGSQAIDETVNFYKTKIDQISPFFTNPEPIAPQVTPAIQPDIDGSQFAPNQNELSPIQPETVDLSKIPMLGPELSRVEPGLLNFQESKTIKPEPIQTESKPKNTLFDVSEFNPNVVSLVDQAADRNGVDKDVFRRLINRESGINPDVQDGKAKEVGLGQIKFTSFTEVHPKGDIGIPADNLEGSARYLKKQHNLALDLGYEGADAWKIAGMAYNGGRQNFREAFGKARKLTNDPIPSVAEVFKYVDPRAAKYGRAITEGIDPNQGVETEDFVKGLGLKTIQGFVGVPKTALNLLDYVGNLFGDEEYRNSFIGKASKSFRGKFFDPTDEIINESLPERFKGELNEDGYIPNLVQFSSAIAELVPQLPGMFAVGTASPVLAGTGFSTTQLYEETLKDARQELAKQGITGDQAESIAQRASFYATAYNSLPTAILSKIGLGKAFAAKGSVLKRAIEGAKADIIPEGLQEGVENIAGNLGIREEIDPNRSIADKSTIRDTILGGGLGAATGGSIAAFNAPIEPNTNINLSDIKPKSIVDRQAKTPIQKEQIQQTPIEATRVPAEFESEVFNPISETGEAKKPHDILVLNLSRQLAEESDPESRKKLVSLIERAQQGEPVRMLAKEIPVFTKQTIEQAPFEKKDIPEPVGQASTDINIETPVAIESIEQPETPKFDLNQLKPKSERQQLPTRQPIKAASGKPIAVKTVTQSLPSKYKVVEASSLIPSHDAKTFSKNPNFPLDVQERSYDTDKQAQARVIEQSQKFDPSFVLSDDNTPVNGPPVVTADGVVLGGNSRTMTIQRVYNEKGRDTAYRTRLTNLASNYGLKKADVQKFDKPVLVRVLDQSPQTTEQARFIGSDLNKGFTADLSETERAISNGKRISNQTLLSVSSKLDRIGENASLRKLFEKDSVDIVANLLTDGVINQREIPSLFDGKRRLLTEKGKNFIESALLGKAVDNAATLDNLPPAIKNKLGAALPTLLRLNSNKAFRPVLEKALSMAIDAKSKGLSPENFIGQSSLFDDAATNQAEQLFLSLSKESGKALKTKFGQLANVVGNNKNQSSFIKQPSIDQAFNRVFGGQEIEESIAVLKEEAVSERAKAKTLKESQSKPKAQPKPKDESKEADPSKLKAKFLSFETNKLNTPQDRAPLDIEPTTDETISKTDILHIVEKQFGATVRNSVTHAMANSKGWFEKQSEIIRIKLGVWGEPQTLTHELAHFIDQRISKSFSGNWLKKALPKDIKEKAYTELKNLDYDPKKTRDYEGFAEFFRHYLTTGRAKELAPTYFEWFENTFLKNALIGPDGKMLLPQEKKSFIPFFNSKVETPKGFFPLSGPIGNLKKAMKVWYGQGAVNRMRSQIDFDGKQEKSFEDSLPRKAYKLAMKELYDSNFIFEEVTTEVKRRTGKNIPPDRDPFALATFYKGKTLSVAETMVRKTMVDPFGRRVGPSLVDAIKPANLKSKKAMEDWVTFSMALRAKNNHERGLESGFEDVDIDHVIKTFGDKKGWKESAKNVSKWSDQLLDWYVWSGDLSPETKALFRDLNPIYLPFMRIFRESVTITGIGGVEEDGAAVKPIRNSTRPFKNPMESFIQSAAAVVSRATKTRIARAVIDLGNEQGLGDLVTKIPLASHSKNFDLGDIAQRSERLQEILKEYSASKPGEPINLDEVVTLWYRDSNYYGKENVVGIWKNGKLELFEIHQDLYQALKEVDPPLIDNKIMKVFASVARLMRLGFTGLNYSFSFFTNPIRDSVWAAVVTKKRMSLPGFNTVKGALKEITASEGSVTDQALNSGLQMATMMGFDRKATGAMYDDMIRRQLGPLGKTLHLGNPFNLVPTVLDKVRGAFQFFELAPRIVELETFEQIQKENPTWSEDSAFIEAFNNAQDVTTNFTKSGRTGKTINQISAFYNVALQSPNKLLRAFKSNPVRTLFRSFLYVTLPAILMWDEVKDEEWYKNIPAEWKYLNMWHETEDGNVLRIPGAHELFILFGGLVVAGLDEARSKDTEAVDGAIKALKKLTVNPFTLDGITPSLVKPLLEVGFNSNWLGHPVEPEWMRDKRTGLPIEDRKFYFTPELSSEISKAFRMLGFELSPIQTNHILRQLTGNLYTKGLGFVDMLSGDSKPGSGNPLNPATFLKFPNRPTRQLEKFYTDIRNLQQKKNGGKANGKEQLRLKQMTQFQGRLKNLQTLIRRQQSKKTPQSLVEINDIYGRMASQLNRFYGD